MTIPSDRLSARPVIMSDGRPLNIAVDGTAASGKGTVGRRLADLYGLRYLDTGAIYRAAAFRLLQAKQSPEDVAAATAAARSVTDDMPDRDLLYSEGVGGAASIISAYPDVRQALLEFQRNVAASSEGSILDGRDIGTVICPDAHVKFFITASLEARAGRRFRQLQSGGETVILERVSDDLRRRDERDSNRDACPMTQAKDAIAIDSSDMNANEVFHLAVEHITRIASS